ncbi:DUF2911 domain-containing protein [Flammeovirgaceae bacterium SG7u.111]|nr:DUF2911 domain-containing protein [Flammeovirgaceae bacterium SG7u.132]WPO34585.1 DUF2911 domain-containing protein [Flammeovirgaceae bacterium SG7u.111]
MKKLIFITLLTFAFAGLFAQQSNPKKRRSEVGLSTFKKGEFYAKVTYGRPQMKWEKSYPFGYNVPWRKIWRTGDDDATELTITKPVEILGHQVDPGTYAIFTIPDTAQWTVILNDEPGQWGLYNYKPQKDLFREKIPVYHPPGQVRQFTISIVESKRGADIFLVWDQTSVSIPMVFLKEEW